MTFRLTEEVCARTLLEAGALGPGKSGTVNRQAHAQNGRKQHRWTGLGDSGGRHRNVANRKIWIGNAVQTDSIKDKTTEADDSLRENKAGGYRPGNTRSSHRPKSKQRHQIQWSGSVGGEI